MTKIGVQILNVSDQSYVGDLVRIRKSYGLSARDLTAFENRYSREMRESDNRLFFISYSYRGPAIAYVQLVLKNADRDVQLADGHWTAHIHDLRVHKEFQRKGYAQDLLQYLEQEARARHIRRLTLAVENSNVAALSLYEKMGYRKFKENPGRSVEEIVFYLRKDLL